MIASAPHRLLPDRLVADHQYHQALDWLYGLSLTPRGLDRAVQRARKQARMERLLSLIGDPQRAYPSVLVVGTKGKGSTAAILSEILRAAGLRIGRYTQPHLLSWCERVWVDGRYIAPGDVARLAEHVRPWVEQVHRQAPELGQLTTFDVGTAITLRYFQERGVDLAVVEAGVGGSRDAGNLTQVELAVITPVSLDHVEVLGRSVAEIAREKAGVIRAGGVVVSAPQAEAARSVIRALARERGATLWEIGRAWRWVPSGPSVAAGPFEVKGPCGRWNNLEMPLLGRHQRDNAATAIAAACLLERTGFRMSPEAIPRGLAAVQWPGRLHVLPTHHSPLSARIVIDGAHNGDSAERLAEALRECFSYERLVLVLGMTEGKDVDGVARALAPVSGCIIATRSSHARAIEPRDLQARLVSLGYASHVAPDLESALALASASAGERDLICVTGSLFLVGEVLEQVPLALHGRESWGEEGGAS